LDLEAITAELDGEADKIGEVAAKLEGQTMPIPTKSLCELGDSTHGGLRIILSNIG